MEFHRLVKEKLFVKSTDGLMRKIEDVNIKDFSKLILKDGDIIEARAVTDKYTNLVNIEGAVALLVNILFPLLIILIN